MSKLSSFASLLWIWMVAVRGPIWIGENAILKVVLSPGSSTDFVKACTVKSPGFLPALEVFRLRRAALPTFLIVMVCDSPLDSMATLGNEILDCPSTKRVPLLFVTAIS